MEQVYDLANESSYFKHLMEIYMKFHTEPSWDHEKRHASFYSSEMPLNCYELLRFGIHHAMCGENVYMLGFPRQIEVPNRPNNLFFLERWADFLDISDLDSALVLVISNRNYNDSHRINETFNHIQQNFKSFISITASN